MHHVTRLSELVIFYWSRKKSGRVLVMVWPLGMDIKLVYGNIPDEYEPQIALCLIN